MIQLGLNQSLKVEECRPWIIMQCPDCTEQMRKHSGFYTCQRCGLSLKPHEIEKAKERAKKELVHLQEKDPMEEHERKRRKMRKYRNWYEGRQEID